MKSSNEKRLNFDKFFGELFRILLPILKKKFSFLSSSQNYFIQILMKLFWIKQVVDLIMNNYFFQLNRVILWQKSYCVKNHGGQCLKEINQKLSSQLTWQML